MACASFVAGHGGPINIASCSYSGLFSYHAISRNTTDSQCNCIRVLGPVNVNPEDENRTRNLVLTDGHDSRDRHEDRREWAIGLDQIPAIARCPHAQGILHLHSPFAVEEGDASEESAETPKKKQKREPPSDNPESACKPISGAQRQWDKVWEMKHDVLCSRIG